MIHKVVHYVDSNTFGGCEEVVLSLLAGLDRTRWQPILFHHEDREIGRLLDGARRLGVHCRSVPRVNGWNRWTTLRQFAREIHAAKPRVFHAHLNWPLGCRYGLFAAGLIRTSAIVATSHLFFPMSGGWGRLKQSIQAAGIDRYIAVSHEVKDRLCQDLRVPDMKVRVVHNGIQFALFDRQGDPAVRDMLTEGSKRAIVFTSARLHSQKGHPYLLEAAALVPDAVFVLAGDGPERDSLKELARTLGVEGRVRFLGHRQDIPQLLASCDLFVLPSLYEGLGLSILEAMAAGKPVVATAIGGPDEVVIPGETGLLVPPGDAVALASAIRTMLSDRSLATRLAEAGRARARELFSSDAMVRGVTDVYDELLR